MNKILQAREARSKLIKSKLDNVSINDKINIIIIKANIIGTNKNTYISTLIINVFFQIIITNINIKTYEYHLSDDGNFYLLETMEDTSITKNMLIQIEDNHKLGRLVDLDLYSKDKNISRRDLGRDFRKCLICDESAIVCMRNKTHSIEEINLEIERIVHGFLKDKISYAIDSAITTEAKLDPKFGLVTINSRGSHPDMDYDLMMKSKEVIIDDLVEMFFYGFNNDDLLLGFKKARKLGIATEKKMFRATNNINTYKGLIFILGITLVSLGYSIKNIRTDLFASVKFIGKDLIKEYDSELNTFGKYAFDNYGFTGARGEVHNGMLSVKKAKRIIKSINEDDLTLALIDIIRNTEDTVLLKRSGSIERYNYFKDLVGSINKYDRDIISKITEECIQNNISFGGSADLFITAIFIYLIEREMGIIYE